MSGQNPPQTGSSYALAGDEKITKVVAYTSNIFARGEVVTKEIIRVSTWLRSPMAPHNLFLRNAQVLVFGGPGALQTQVFSEYFLTVSQVIAFHMLPPAQDPVDYDASEPNRKMEPITVLVGTFRFNGHIRMSSQATLEKHLDISREAFMSLYDVEISNPGIPSMGIVKVPMVIVRPNLVTTGFIAR